MTDHLWSVRHAVRVILSALGALCLVLGLHVPVSAAPSATVGTAEITLSSVSPHVGTPGQPLVVSGTVTNSGDAEVADPVVRVGLSGNRLTTRDQVSDWVTGENGRASTELGQTTLRGPLAPDETRSFQLLIPSGRLPTDTTLTNLPAVLSLTDGTATSASTETLAQTPTVIPWKGDDDPVADPLPVTWVVPLTLPADPALFSEDGEKRLAAWRRAIGARSQVDQLLRRLRGLPVTWLVDPTMLEPPVSPSEKLPGEDAKAEGDPGDVPTASPEPTPSEAPATSSSSSSSGSAPTGSAPTGSDPAPSGTTEDANPGEGASTGSPSGSGGPSESSTTEPPKAPQEPEPQPDDSSVSSLVDDLRRRLVNRGETQPVWWLPYGDPDLLALRQVGGTAAVEQHLDREPSVANRSMSQTTVHWPASAPSAEQLSTISTTWEDTRRGGKPITLLSSDQVQASTGASARLGDGTPVLSYDDHLSELTGTSEQLSSAQRVQAFLGDSLARRLSGSSSRELFVLAPRHGTADPEALADLVATVPQAPWLTNASGSALLENTERSTSTTTVTRPTPEPGPSPASPITQATLERTAADRRLLGEIGSILVDSQDVIAGWNAAYDELGSTRWRGAGDAHTQALDGLSTRLHAVPEQITVRPGSINFFTDEGEVGVTVVNDLNRPVHRVRLELEPRLAILVVDEQSELLTIRPASRATVRVPIKALSSGQVKVDARVTTPTGLVLGEPDAPTQLEFTVRPTGSWLYWVLGAVAGPILVIGIYRSLRTPRRDPEPGLTPAEPQHEGDDD